MFSLAILKFHYSQSLLVLLLASFFCSGALASTFSDSSGLLGSLSLDTDFSDAIAELGVDEAPGDFYPNVSFNQFLLGPSVAGPSGIRTLVSPHANPSLRSSIVVTNPIGGIAFLIRAAVPIRITAYLASAEIATVLTNGEGYENPVYYGFGDISLDEVVFTFDSPPVDIADRFMAIDQLQLGTVEKPRAVRVPLMATANCFVALFVGVCAIRVLRESSV